MKPADGNAIWFVIAIGSISLIGLVGGLVAGVAVYRSTSHYHKRLYRRTVRFKSSDKLSILQMVDIKLYTRMRYFTLQQFSLFGCSA